MRMKNDVSEKEIVNWINNYRNTSGVTMISIAKRLNKTPTTVSNCLAGITRLTLSDAIAISNLLGLTFEGVVRATKEARTAENAL